MQKIIFLITIVFLFASCKLGNVKNSTEKTILHHDIVVMIDNTEGGEYHWSNILMNEDLVKLFTINGEQYYGSVTFTDINDISMNRIQSAKLTEPSPYKDGSTGLTRKKTDDANKKALLKSFGEVSKLYDSFMNKKSSEEKKNSILYGPITKAINRLAESEADEKTLIILSDMIENSDCGNFYKATAKNYEKIISDLIKCSGATITPDSGVKVIILFQTGDPEKDKLFVKSMEIWGIIFDTAGIPYEIKPNL